MSELQLAYISSTLTTRITVKTKQKQKQTTANGPVIREITIWQNQKYLGFKSIIQYIPDMCCMPNLLLFTRSAV